MKLLLSGLGIFFFSFTALAETFTETFDGGKLDNWQELVMFGLESAASWEIIDSELHAIQNTGGVTHLLTIGKETWQDYDVEFDVKPLEKHGPGNIAIATRIRKKWGVPWGVICRIEEALGAKPVAECFAGNLHGDLFLTYGEKPHALLKLQKWATFKLSVHGKLLTFWINGKQVLDPIMLEPLHGFPEFPTGKVGLGLANYTARFDNLKITGPGIPNRDGLSVTPQTKLATTWGTLKQF